MKMMSYFKKHFVTRVRNFVFTYRKSIERKCHTTVKDNAKNIFAVLRSLSKFRKFRKFLQIKFLTTPILAAHSLSIKIPTPPLQHLSHPQKPHPPSNPKPQTPIPPPSTQLTPFFVKYKYKY